MDKQEIDELYHNLRRLSVSDDMLQKEAVAGIVSHLTQPGGDYNGLLRYLSYYGERFLLGLVVKVLSKTGALHERIIELGAGFGWLGRGLSSELNIPAIFVDKRQYVFTDIIADLETKNGLQRVLDVLRKGDLLVMSEFIHCLNDPVETLRPFRPWPALVVEYSSSLPKYHSSYVTQLRKFGCNMDFTIDDIFPLSNVTTHTLDTHVIYLVTPPKEELAK